MILGKHRGDGSGTGGRRAGLEFTQELRATLSRARDEAMALGHRWVGTEHLLLALMRSASTDLSQLFSSLGVQADDVRERVAAEIASADLSSGAPYERDPMPPYTSRAKRAVELAMNQAKASHSVVGVEHLLVGLLEEGKGIAAKVLRSLGLSLEEASRLLHDGSAGASEHVHVMRFRVSIDDSSDRSIYEQIVERIREGVATGKLRPDDRLPTVRQLADELDIAPGTVARAYAELERMGVVVTEGARGTRVASRARASVSDAKRPKILVGLLRPATIAAYHLGASAPELREALATAMQDIFGAD
jgi:ATP-dependent Clp protease ATP-binding subunit ClpC